MVEVLVTHFPGWTVQIVAFAVLATASISLLLLGGYLRQKGRAS